VDHETLSSSDRKEYRMTCYWWYLAIFILMIISWIVTYFIVIWFDKPGCRNCELSFKESGGYICSMDNLIVGGSFICEEYQRRRKYL